METDPMCVGQKSKYYNNNFNYIIPQTLTLTFTSPRGGELAGANLGRGEGHDMDDTGKGKGKGRGDDGVKCATGCGKPGTKRCNGCNAVFYCSVECQRIHWKKNGHKAACKKTQARVAAALASAAGGAPAQGGRGTAKGASVCIICLDAGDPPPIQSGCGCRGDAGLAHVGCRAEAAEHKSKSRSGDFGGWHTCTTCGQGFTTQMQMGLAETYWGAVQHLDEANRVRQDAGVVLVSALVEQGRYAESEAKCRELLAVQQRLPGPDSVAGIATAHVLGMALYEQYKVMEAEAVLREVLSKRRGQLGAEHPHTLETLLSLGNVFSAQGKLDDALATYQEVRRIQQRVLGAEHLSTMTSTLNIASTLGRQSKFQEAEVLLRELLEVQQRVLGADHPVTLDVRHNLCAALYDQHKYGEAKTRCRELLAVSRRVLGAANPDTIATSRLLASISSRT